jgi:parvulin-like peptidyl-prolyl isomerase
MRGVMVIRNGAVNLVITLMAMVVVAGAGERILLEGPLVRVNDRIVTVTEFTDRVRQELIQVQQQPTSEELHQFVEMLLTEVVNELVLMERATEKRLAVDDQMVDQAIANLREENNLQDDEAWEQALKTSGLSVEGLRERYRRTILLQRAVQGEVRPIEITEEELRQQYEENKEDYKVPAKIELEQVFIPVDDDASLAQGERTAQGMVSRVRDGADLKAEATLAGAELQDLGEIPVDDCRADLVQALEGLDDGAITNPLPVPGGIQVIRLVRRIPAGYRPFEDVSQELRRQRSAESYESQTRGLVEKLRAEYLVEVHEEYLDLVYAQLGAM